LGGIIDAINNNEIEIITSAWTFCEVLYYKKNELTQEQADELQSFFRNDFIIPANVDRDVAELARNLFFQHEKLSNKDAIHIATAVKHHVLIFDTFDGDLINLNGKIGNPPLKIAKPNIPHQADLFEKDEKPKRIKAKREKSPAKKRSRPKQSKK